MLGMQTNNLKPKWLDHFNSIWASGASEVVATREGILILFGRLITNKEIYTASPLPYCQKHGNIYHSCIKLVWYNNQPYIEGF